MQPQTSCYGNTALTQTVLHGAWLVISHTHVSTAQSPLT